LETIAEGLKAATLKEREGALRHAVQFLEEELKPHAMREEVALYPPVEPLIKAHGRAVASMEMDHQAILGEIQGFSQEVRQLLARGASEEEMVAVFRRILRQAHALRALVSLHLRKEEELLIPLAEAHLPEGRQEEIVHRMHEAEAEHHH